MDRTPVIVAIGRSAVCRSRKGSFATTHPIEICNQVLRGVLDQVPQLDHNDIDDLVLGCAAHTNQCSQNMARLVVQRAELPDTVCGQTINRFCSSGLQAIATSMNEIIAGQADVVIAGGVESMSYCYGAYPDEYRDEWLNNHDVDVKGEGSAYMGMGITAENVAKKYGINREDMEKLALRSHTRAAIARKDGKLAPSIIPVKVVNPAGEEEIVKDDQGILAELDGTMKTSLEKMSGMKTCFIDEEDGGLVTAATSSQTSDAAAFAIVMTMDKANELGIKPIAKMLGYAVEGVDPKYMGLGPIEAVPVALKRAGMTMDQIDEVELNEAFASQAIACMQDLGLEAGLDDDLDPAKDKDKDIVVNPYGNAMALGHPMGATGIFLTCKMLDWLRENDKKYGIVTMCIGGGMGAAGVFERLI
ncbi:MAG: thiolase family protein [Eubacterium sp.]|nr:thiolase family protein [Eubacterium sp.]